MINKIFANTLLMLKVCRYQKCSPYLKHSRLAINTSAYKFISQRARRGGCVLHAIHEHNWSRTGFPNPGSPANHCESRVSLGQHWKMMTCTPVYSFVASSGSIHTVTLSTGTSLLPSILFRMSAGMFWLQVILSSSLSCSSLFTCQHTHAQ